MTSYSVYPWQIDAYNTLPLRRDGIDEIVAADVNRLRDAIVKIEQELGVQPSGTFGTVADRLDDIGDAKALILAHVADTEDAHDASAISIADSDDNYFEDDVEGALEELSTLLPPHPDNIGENDSKIPNSGIASFYDGYGTKSVFNMSSVENVLKRTQPSTVSPGIRGVHIFEVSDNTPNGDGYLKLYHSASTDLLYWQAPGDEDFGDPVDITSLNEGEVVTISSETANKKIRVTRNSLPLATPGEGVSLIENFEVYALESASGYYSLQSIGIKSTSFITRTSISSTEESRYQAMISGMVFPADRGTLVLQRKLRGTADYYPVAVLNLSDIFDDTKRADGQLVYVPTLEDFDTITLYDRYPVKGDYDVAGQDANGNNVYEDFENQYTRLQVAKYLIPLSNPDVIGGELESPSDTTATETDENISSYRILHYKETATAGLTGNPPANQLYSTTDAWWDLSEHDENSTVRFSNVYLDDIRDRPGVEMANLRPASPAPSVTEKTLRSGILYYNSSSDKFDIEILSDRNLFNKTYKNSGILTLDSDVFVFPSGTSEGNWGSSVDVTELLDDGYFKWADSNLPDFDSQAYYIIDDSTLINGVTTNVARRIYPDSDKFSAHSYITATLSDPFGPGDAYWSYGVSAEYINRILTNSYSVDRATDAIEYFTDESRRIDDSIEFDDLSELSDYDSSGYWSFSGRFDNESALPSGSLQVGGRFVDSESNVPGLIYPQDDYTTHVMPENTGRDYSGRTGDCTYRRMLTLGYPISSGRLQIASGGNSLVSFADIDWRNPNRFAKVEVKIPGNGTNSTGWLDISRLFETGQYTDGFGALHGEVEGATGDFIVPFTFGTRNSSLSGYTSPTMTDSMRYGGHIALKITYFGTDVVVREIAKQKIITMVQLLPWNGVI